ncbi:Non-specific lipid-transfer protein 2-like protein [Drosera capensis]
MASSSVVVKLASVLIVCMTVIASHIQVSQAASCNAEITALAPCLTYLKASSSSTSSKCCSGCKSLIKTTNTKSKRQAACNCLKSLAAKYKVQASRAQQLPSKCGFSIPYTISTSTDCSKVN